LSSSLPLPRGGLGRGQTPFEEYRPPLIPLLGKEGRN